MAQRFQMDFKTTEDRLQIILRRPAELSDVTRAGLNRPSAADVCHVLPCNMSDFGRCWTNLTRIVSMLADLVQVWGELGGIWPGIGQPW